MRKPASELQHDLASGCSPQLPIATPHERALTIGCPEGSEVATVWAQNERRGCPPALAVATVEWTTRFGLDLVQYNPRAQYHAEPWGTRYRYGGAERPTLERMRRTASAAPCGSRCPSPSRGPQPHRSDPPPRPSLVLIS
jgi:hypothetical protein